MRFTIICTSLVAVRPIGRRILAAYRNNKLVQNTCPVTFTFIDAMRPIATDGVVWSVCLYVCLSVGHVREPCKNGWTDRDAIWAGNSDGAKEPCIRWSPYAKGRDNFWRMSGPLKALRVTAAVYAAKKSIAASGRLQQRTVMLPTGRCSISAVKNPLSLRCGLSSKFFNHL